MKDVDITPFLERAHQGDREAMETVARAVLDDLKRVARKMMYRRYGDQARRMTLDTMALVNETFIKLLRQRNEYKNREHLFAIATRVMLRVLADYDKGRQRKKRGADRVRISLSALGRKGAVEPQTEMPALRTALEQLGELNERAARVAKLRLLWGLNPAEIGDVIGVSRSTADRSWRFAQKWLAENL